MANIHSVGLRKSFRDELIASIAGFSVVPLAPENRDFVPPTGGTVFYVERMEYDPQRKVATGTVEVTGRYVLEVSIGAGQGTELVESRADQVVDVLEPGKPALSSQGLQIAVDRASRGGGRIVERWGNSFYAVTVSVHWRFYTPTDI